MKTKKCVVCNKQKARRICRPCSLHDNKQVCSHCCGKILSLDCGDCQYYESAKKYASVKTKKSKEKKFIIEINEDAENAVDHALGFVERGDTEKARAIITDLMRQYPGNHMVHYGMGVTYAFDGENDQAIAYFDKAIDIFPYFIEALYNKGVAYKEKMDVGNAINAFREVVEIGDPKDDMVKQAGKFIKTIENSTFKQFGIDVDTYLGCQVIFDEAFAHMERREWQNAIDGFKTCLAKNRNHPQSYGNMGICYAQLGQRPEALAALDRALELDPSYQPAIMNRAMVESLKEGEILEDSKMESVEYYKEVALKKRSNKRSIFQR